MARRSGKTAHSLSPRPSLDRPSRSSRGSCPTLPLAVRVWLVQQEFPRWPPWQRRSQAKEPTGSIFGAVSQWPLSIQSALVLVLEIETTNPMRPIPRFRRRDGPQRIASTSTDRVASPLEQAVEFVSAKKNTEQKLFGAPWASWEPWALGSVTERNFGPMDTERVWGHK